MQYSPSQLGSLDWSGNSPQKDSRNIFWFMGSVMEEVFVEQTL